MIRHYAVALAFMAIALATRSARAHDFIDARMAVLIGERITAVNTTASAQADAWFSLAEMLDQVVELLNRDLDAHGSTVSLPAAALAADLKTRGVVLEYAPERRRYLHDPRPYQRYLALASAGARRADAEFRIVAAGFYDSFDVDPLEPYALDWPGLSARIQALEAFIRCYPDYAEREEARFILAVELARAALFAPTPEQGEPYRQWAPAALAAFRAEFPTSLRATAADSIRQRLDR